MGEDVDERAAWFAKAREPVWPIGRADLLPYKQEVARSSRAPPTFTLDLQIAVLRRLIGDDD